MRSGRAFLQPFSLGIVLLASSCHDDDCARTSTCEIAAPIDAGNPDARPSVDAVPIVYFGGSLSKEGTVTLTPGKNGEPGAFGAAGAAVTNGAPGTAGERGAALTAPTRELVLTE